jgi:hypothetical protein
MTVRVKSGVTGGSNVGSLLLSTTVDTWTSGSFFFTTNATTYKARIIFFKTAGTDPIRIDDVSVTVSSDVTWTGISDSN